MQPLKQAKNDWLYTFIHAYELFGFIVSNNNFSMKQTRESLYEHKIIKLICNIVIGW